MEVLTSQAAPAVTKQRMSAAERREQIIAAAREVFVEQGVTGARSRQIAERAGITEAYLYRHFHSKDELYRLAVDAPLKTMLDQVESEVNRLAERDDVSRTEVLFHCHSLLLGSTVEIAPLLAAAMFSDPEPGREFYLDNLLPTFRAVVESIIPAITGWPLKAFEVDVFAQSLLGIHLGIAFDSLLDETTIDVSNVARQVTVMFAQSMLAERDRTSARSRGNAKPTPGAKTRPRSSPKGTTDHQPLTRKRLPAAERRVKIIEAARDAFLHGSMNGARTKDIADRAGVTEAFLYRYFDSKEAMYEAAVLEPLREAIAALADDLAALNDEVDDPIEFVRQVHRRCLEFFVNYARLQSIALFAEIGSGRKFYAEAVKAHLDRLGYVLAKHTGWDVRGLDPVVVRRCALGAQFIVGLDHGFRQDAIDLDFLANELTVLFTGGIKEKPSVVR